MICLRENEQPSAHCFFLSPGGRGTGLERKLKLICVSPSSLGERIKVRLKMRLVRRDYLSSKNANSFDKEPYFFILILNLLCSVLHIRDVLLVHIPSPLGGED
jgi:hypothetical protein